MKHTNKVKKVYRNNRLINLVFYCPGKEKYTSVQSVRPGVVMNFAALN